MPKSIPPHFGLFQSGLPDLSLSRPDQSQMVCFILPCLTLIYISLAYTPLVYPVLTWPTCRVQSWYARAVPLGDEWRSIEEWPWQAPELHHQIQLSSPPLYPGCTWLLYHILVPEGKGNVKSNDWKWGESQNILSDNSNQHFIEMRSTVINCWIYQYYWWYLLWDLSEGVHWLQS